MTTDVLGFAPRFTDTATLRGRQLAEQAGMLLNRLGAAIFAPRETQPRGAAELLALADRYEATMPSYAADLRAAALAGRTQA